MKQSHKQITSFTIYPDCHLSNVAASICFFAWIRFLYWIVLPTKKKKNKKKKTTASSCLKQVSGYEITQSLRHEQDVTQGQFLSWVQLIWI